ncbi:MAG TPA: CoA transferase [Caulobacteraceae bacterium]|jgi:benzylsuccinate CoA-transferase BbsE subunit|nr:CoA transferase [Caulobacteraceae bacterium]
MLADVRVLELSAPSTMLAGQILGDLGADVVTVEPPAGAKGRRLPPFVDALPGLENSLTWHALNRNKRGVTLDVAGPDGRAILGDLIQQFDIVIEWVDGRSCLEGLARPEGLIVCEIAAFSRTGPKACYLATDAVLTAAGGAAAMAGDPDRPPGFFPVPQPMMEAGAEAAVAALAALSARDRLGGGQTVEVQARIAAAFASMGRLLVGRSGDRALQRAPAQAVGRMPVVPGTYACADGWVTITVAFGPSFVAMTQRIASWLAEEGALRPELAQVNLMEVARAAARGDGDPEPIERLVCGLVETCKAKSKAEVVEISKRHRFMAAPAMDMGDIAGFEHYRQRGLFVHQKVGDRVIDAPARFAQFANYQIEVRRPAPRLSQHTTEVLSEFAGLNGLELQALFERGVI